MLAEILHKLAGFENKEQEYRPRPSLAGSERCIRQLVYMASKTPKDKQTGDRFIHIMDDSSWHEVLTADWLRKSAYKLHSEQMWIKIEKDNINMKGCIDGIITDLLEKDYLWENKAINHFSFERYWNGELPFDYISQCCLYLYGIQAVNPDIDTAILLIKNKNTSAFIDYTIQYDSKKDSAAILEVTHSNGQKKILNHIIELPVQNAFDKFNIIQHYVDKKELPGRPFEVGIQFPCGYCSWEDTCWAGYEIEYQKLSTEALLEGEIVELCAYYLETNMHISEMEKEKDSLKEKIKTILKEKQVSKGKAGEYTISNVLRKTTRLDKELIPIDILKAATKEGLQETLTIRKIKKGA